MSEATRGGEVSFPTRPRGNTVTVLYDVGAACMVGVRLHVIFQKNASIRIGPELALLCTYAAATVRREYSATSRFEERA